MPTRPLLLAALAASLVRPAGALADEIYDCTGQFASPEEAARPREPMPPPPSWTRDPDHSRPYFRREPEEVASCPAGGGLTLNDGDLDMEAVLRFIERSPLAREAVARFRTEAAEAEAISDKAAWLRAHPLPSFGDPPARDGGPSPVWVEQMVPGMPDYHAGAAASYHPDERTIYINRRSDLGLLAPTLYHEIIHSQDSRIPEFGRTFDPRAFLGGITAVCRQVAARAGVPLRQVTMSSFTRDDFRLMDEAKAPREDHIYRVERRAYEGQVAYLRDMLGRVRCYDAFLDEHRRVNGFSLLLEDIDGHIASRYGVNRPGVY